MERLNMLAPEYRKNPYPHYAELRAAGSLVQVDPGDLWAVSRYDDVLAVLKDPVAFSSHGLHVVAAPPWMPNNPLVESLVFYDPPRHTGVRALVTHAFSSRILPRIEPLARAFARNFAERVQNGAEIDVAEDLAGLPAAVIANLLGYEGDRNAIRRWSEDIVAVTTMTPPEIQAQVHRTVAELRECITKLFADRRSERKDDLASDLLDAEIDGVRLTEEELIGFMVLLIVAGFDTTSHLLTNSLRILSERPALLTRLQNNPEDIPSFIEEVLRYEPSVHGTIRLTLTDTKVGATALPAGAIVLVLLASANRDESRYENAETFDIDRKFKPSMAFGHGIHFCLGAALARAETRIALEELLPRISGISVVGEPEWNIALTIRGAMHCRMRFQPRG